MLSFEQPELQFKSGSKPEDGPVMVIVGKYKCTGALEQVVMSREPTDETIFYLGTSSKNSMAQNFRLDLSCLEKLRLDIEENGDADLDSFKGIVAEKVQVGIGPTAPF